MDSSNVPPVGSRPIKTPKRRLNKGSSTGSFDSSSFGAPSQPAFGTAPSSPGGSVQPFGQQQQQQQMFSGFNPSSMTSNSPQSPSFQQQQQPTMGGFGNVQAPPAPPVFTFGTSTPTSIPQTPPASSGFAFGNQNQNTGFNSGFQQQSSAGGFNATPSNTFSFGAPSAPQQQQQSTINSNPFGTQTPTSGSNHQFTTTDSSMDSSDDQTKPATGFSFGTQAPTTTTSSSSFASPTFKGQSSFTMNFGDQSKPTTSGFSFGSGANSTGAGNTLTSGQQSTDTQQNQSFGGFGAQSKTTSSTPAPAFSFGNPQATATSSQVQKDSNQTPSSPFSFGGNIFGTGATVSGNTGFGSTPKEGEKKDENKSSVSSPSSFGSTIVPQGQKDSNQTPSSPFSFSGSASGAGAGVSGNTGFGSTPTKEGEKKEENKPSVSSPFSFGSTTGTKNTGDQPTSNSPFGSTKDNSGDVDKSNDQESASKTSALSFSFGSTTGSATTQDKPSSPFSFGVSSAGDTTSGLKRKGSDLQLTQPNKMPSFQFNTKTTFGTLEKDKVEERDASTTNTSIESATTGDDKDKTSAPAQSETQTPAVPASTPTKETDKSTSDQSSLPEGQASVTSTDSSSQQEPSSGRSGDQSKTTSSAPAAAFSFGNPPATAASSQGQKDSNQPSSSPFSFGTGAAVSGNTGFGSTPAKENEKKDGNKPLISSPFSFGSTTATKPTSDGSSEKPAVFSFGTPTSKPTGDESASKRPAFSFGTPASKSTSDESTTKAPAFSFVAPASKPSSDESTVKAPAFSFGTPSSKPSSDESASKPPAFTFAKPASKPTSDESTTKPPVFSFGTPVPAPSNESASKPPVFSFGTPAPKPANQFTFGQPDPASKKDNSDNVDKSKGQGSVSKPPTSSFSFGSTTDSATKPSKPSNLFSFGAPSSDDTTLGLKRKGSDLQSTLPAKLPSVGFGSKTTFESPAKDKAEERGASTTNASTEPASVADDKNKTSTPSQLKPQTPAVPVSTPTKETDKPASTQFSLPKGPTSSSFAIASTKPNTPPPVVKLEDTFKPLVTKDSTPITVSSTSTPNKGILKSSSTSKDTFGVAAPSTSVQTAVQSSITSVDQIKDSTRFAQLPTDAQTVLLDAEQFIHNQLLFSRNIQTRIDAFGGEDILHVNTQVSKLLDNVGALKEQLQVQSQQITHLGTDIKQQMDATEISKTILERGQTKRIPRSGDLQKYFAVLYEKLKTQLVEFESTIRQIEARLQKETSSDQSVQDIGMVLSSQNQLFLSLTGQASQLHQQVQSLLPQGNNNNNNNNKTNNNIASMNPTLYNNTATRTFALP